MNHSLSLANYTTHSILSLPCSAWGWAGNSVLSSPSQHYFPAWDSLSSVSPRDADAKPQPARFYARCFIYILFLSAWNRATLSPSTSVHKSCLPVNVPTDGETIKGIKISLVKLRTWCWACVSTQVRCRLAAAGGLTLWVSLGQEQNE